MFPIPSGQTLSFIDIADYWSREIKPSASQHELRSTISKAWWRGELVAANGPNRVQLLRALYLKCAECIAFSIPGAPEPPCSRVLDDGRVEVYLLPRIPLPNAQPDTWIDANCAEAFNAIAEAWDEKVFSLLAIEVPFIVLTRSEFIQWIDKCRYKRPTFWGSTSEDEDQQQPTNETVRRKPTKPVQYRIQRAVEALAKERSGKFPPEGMPIYERDRLITEWLDADDDPMKRPSKRTLRKYFNKQRT
jgi:hypothetical protein